MPTRPVSNGSLIRLGYRIPGVIRAAIQRHVPLSHASPYGPALDLGCGTGLIAVALSDLSIRPIHGVDLSPRMLAKAVERNLYDCSSRPICSMPSTKTVPPTL